MTIGLIGKKLGMTRIYDEAGSMIPVTVIQAGPCPILQVKSKTTDGYAALQLGFGEKSKNKVNRPMQGHFKRAGTDPTRVIREFRTEDLDGYETGQMLDLELFQVGEKVDVIGVSKGRGFAGPQKRWNASCGPATHGSRYHRRAGSLGASASPSRVFKGRHAAGHMGAGRVTMQNITVVKLDRQRNLIVVRGSVPGHENGYVMIRKSVKAACKQAARKG